MTANVVRREGRLYAFEGNPELFPSLQRTLLANGHFANPNLVAANLLVSDRCGRGTLYCTPEAFYLGTMSDVPLWGDQRRSIEAEMTTIDAFLPPDLAVDLVKSTVLGFASAGSCRGLNSGWSDWGKRSPASTTAS